MKKSKVQIQTDEHATTAYWGLNPRCALTVPTAPGARVFRFAASPLSPYAAWPPAPHEGDLPDDLRPLEGAEIPEPIRLAIERAVRESIARCKHDRVWRTRESSYERPVLPENDLLFWGLDIAVEPRFHTLTAKRLGEDGRILAKVKVSPDGEVHPVESITPWTLYHSNFQAGKPRTGIHVSIPQGVLGDHAYVLWVGTPNGWYWEPGPLVVRLARLRNPDHFATAVDPKPENGTVPVMAVWALVGRRALLPFMHRVVQVTPEENAVTFHWKLDEDGYPVPPNAEGPTGRAVVRVDYPFPEKPLEDPDYGYMDGEHIDADAGWCVTPPEGDAQALAEFIDTLPNEQQARFERFVLPAVAHNLGGLFELFHMDDYASPEDCPQK